MSSKKAFAPLVKAFPALIVLVLVLCLWSASSILLPFSMMVQFRFLRRHESFIIPGRAVKFQQQSLKIERGRTNLIQGLKETYDHTVEERFKSLGPNGGSLEGSKVAIHPFLHSEGFTRVLEKKSSRRGSLIEDMKEINENHTSEEAFEGSTQLSLNFSGEIHKTDDRNNQSEDSIEGLKELSCATEPGSSEDAEYGGCHTHAESFTESSAYRKQEEREFIEVASDGNQKLKLSHNKDVDTSMDQGAKGKAPMQNRDNATKTASFLQNDRDEGLSGWEELPGSERLVEGDHSFKEIPTNLSGDDIQASNKKDSNSGKKDEADLDNNFSVMDPATKEAMKLVEVIRATAMPRTGLAERCDKGRVYMYNLPSKFNRDLLRNCEQLIPWFNMCPSFQNSGMGELIKNKLKEDDGATLLPADRWYETHQYALEVIFHSRLENYPCLTSDPGQADLFYIPFYGGLDILRWHFRENATHSRKDQLGLELISWLEVQEWWRRKGGADHVLVLGKITFDFRRVNDSIKSWGSNLLNQPQMQKVTKLLIERQPWHENDVGIPHPTFFHPRSDSDIRIWQSHIHHAQRQHLVSFAGLPRPDQADNIRSILINHCVNRSDVCHYLPCIGNICMQPKTAMSLFLHSHFCLQPPGDSPTRRSIFDSLIAGCIPVFFDPYSAYLQYPWHLPANASHYSVYVPPDLVKDSKVNVVEVLERVPASVREEMRRRIIYEIMPGLVYAETGEEITKMEDAFDISMRSLIWRMSNKKELNEGSF